MTFTVQMRSLAHAEPHEPLVLGPEPLVSPAVKDMLQHGSYRILSARRGLTISVFDLLPGGGTPGMLHSAPCVALNILFEGAGQGVLVENGSTSAAIPFRPAFYCMIAPHGAAGRDTLRVDARFRGIDIRMTPDLWHSLGGPDAADLLATPHPLHVASNREVWVGMLPLSPDVLRMARSLFETVQTDGPDLLAEARALDVIGAAIGALRPQPTEAHLITRDQRAIARVIAMMDADLARPWTVGELALAAGIGLKRLKLQFPKETGLPVYAYLQERRLAEAHRLLSGKGIAVTEVALAVGYSSLSHFATLFRRRFGLAPSAVATAA